MRRIPVCVLAVSALAMGASARADDPASTGSMDNPQYQAPAPAPTQAQPQAAQLRPGPGERIVCVPNQPQACAADCGPTNVHFDFDSDELTPDAKVILNRNADCLKANHERKVSIIGATDEVGSYEYNKALGERRAKAVSTFLESKGVSSDQVQAMSIGKSQPVCGQRTEDCDALNRRAIVQPSEKVASLQPNQ